LSFSLIGSYKSLCIVLKVLFLHCQNFLGHKCDDKYSIFGYENVLLEVIYLPNGSWKLSKFMGSSSAMKKESIAHFSAFLANCLGDGQNLGAQNGKY